MHVSIGQASKILGVAISTLRRWELEGRFSSSFRTPGGHRRYSLLAIKKKFFPSKIRKNRKIYGYARVSSHDQKLDLKRQEQRLENYCIAQAYNYTIISDLGSGINYNKKGLNQLINLICTYKVEKIIITHKDRLLRFGYPLLEKLCKLFNTKIEIISKSLEKTDQEKLVADVIEIMTVFTAKLHGMRSHKNSRLKKLNTG